MRNELQIFNSPEFGQVRSIMIEGEPWFVGKDLARAFGDSDYKRSIARLDSDDRSIARVPTPGGMQSMIVVNESGLYSLIFYMQPQKAKGVSQNDTLINGRIEKLKKFKRWVTSEVLPALRKTGSYSIAPEIPERKLTADDYLRAASIISTCKNERLPYVLDLLKKSGIKIPKLQSEQSKSVAGRDIEGRARKAIGTAKLVYGITYADISRKSGVTRQQIGRIYSGESVPTLERSEVVCDAIHDLIVKTTA